MVLASCGKVTYDLSMPCHKIYQFGRFFAKKIASSWHVHMVQLVQVPVLVPESQVPVQLPVLESQVQVPVLENST